MAIVKPLKRENGITKQFSDTDTIDATKIADASVSNTEFQYLDGVTSQLFKLKLIIK
jgi:hypothetical protein